MVEAHRGAKWKVTAPRGPCERKTVYRVLGCRNNLNNLFPGVPGWLNWESM